MKLAGTHRDLTPLEGWQVRASNGAAVLDCSLIVATYQRSGEIEELLTHLLTLKELPAEIVIVDSSPNRDTDLSARRAIADRALPFDVIYARSPKGLTRQRNVGVDLSSYPILCFLDDDAQPREGYFSQLCSVLQEDTQGSIGAVGACIINEINKPINRRWKLRRALGLIARSEPYVYNHAGTTAPSGLLKPFIGIRDVDMFPGGACAIRRSVLDVVRFSEFFDGYSYGEDLEMSLRIRRRWRVVCCGDAHVWHFGVERQGGRPKAFAKGRMEVRNRYFIWRRYSADAPFLDRIRFNLDLMFIFVMDLAWFVARPTQLRNLTHGCGLVAGFASCLLDPPTSQDPSPVLRYRLECSGEMPLQPV